MFPGGVDGGAAVAIGNAQIDINTSNAIMITVLSLMFFPSSYFECR
jgi:hypothetical protein